MPDPNAVVPSILRAVGFVGSAVLMVGTGSAAPGAGRPTTSLHRCGAQTCLVISGRREDPAAPIRVAGHEVSASGGRDWRATVPLASVRAWSATAARSITIEVAGPGREISEAALPIGLLGHVTELADLDVGARR